MKQSIARNFVILSLILSLISFILSVIAFYSPNWKYVQIRSSSQPVANSGSNQIDPLIRSEVDKYHNILYRRGIKHSYGLLTHCITEGECGQNFLPLFDDNDYELCHSINYHHECIFSNLALQAKTCTCQKPSYIKITYNLLILILILHLIFIFINILRLYCHRCPTSALNDIQFRLIAVVSTLFSVLFLIIILLQQNMNRLHEPLEFFQSMHRHYLRIQIYKFSNDLESVMKQIEHDLDIRFGASYICIIFILILTFVSFLTSSTVEIKIVSKFEEDEKVNDQNLILIPPTSTERFVPFEQIRFPRQTRV